MSTFRTIHTNSGLARLNAAGLGGAEIRLGEIAFGDGAGNPVDPRPQATGLVRERYRTQIARVYADPANPLLLYAEGVLPADQGGFVIREMAIFDSDGTMFCVANTPEVYQPLPSEGAIADGIYRIAFSVSNAGNVQITLDPNASVASRSWVLNLLAEGAAFPGGMTGQVLTKFSNDDGDAGWQDPGQVTVAVDTIEEHQVLAASQTVVDLVLTNTQGLAIYVDGQRLPKMSGADGWLPHGDVYTRLVLGKTYPAGTRLIAVQNEPAGGLRDSLERGRNLEDVPNKAQARAHLGVPSLADAATYAPAGMVGMFAGANAPGGWLRCNGAQVSRTAYPSLYAAIGDVYTPVGSTPSAGHFFLPDLRGVFPRFHNDGAGPDAGRVLGSRQDDEIRSHAHEGRTAESGEHNHDSGWGEAYLAQAPYGTSQHRPGNRNVGSNGGLDHDNYAFNTSSDGNHAHDFETTAVGGLETRPVNVALMACIKY